MEERTRRRIITVASVLLALMFLAAGVPKMVQPQSHVEQFAQWGYPAWFVYCIGVVEAGGAILLLIPRTRFYAALLLTHNLLGILYTHLKAGEYTHLLIPAVLLALAVLVAWSCRPGKT